ncbi:MAG: DNA methyltransferase [Flavobacteriaceae bacterium]|nr:DNA methyltransferase [Flavobacteriaceae bacterium]
MQPTTITPEFINVRATVNEWLSQNFPIHRKDLVHSKPIQIDDSWLILLYAYAKGERSNPVGKLLLNANYDILNAPKIEDISSRVSDFLLYCLEKNSIHVPKITDGDRYDFRLGDGIESARRFVESGIDLLLTDPPYGISKAYTCEKQVSRRLRKDGTDFIMPRGSFGDWDSNIDPQNWTKKILPKVKGWAITFCAQAQIGEYVEIFKNHGFVAVGTLVWQKTNPVPFNHRYKPINAWEAAVIGKRPGAKFNGGVTHNVFVCKSPSPQERIHPTQKPLELMREFVQLFSLPGETIYDPFSGSATTVIAAALEGRIGVGYELDNEIYLKARRRIKDKLETIV